MRILKAASIALAVVLAAGAYASGAPEPAGSRAGLNPALALNTPCETLAASLLDLHVVITPFRQEVLYPFGARISVFVTDASTHQPISHAMVMLVYQVPRANGDLVWGAIFRKTNKNGEAKILIPTGPSPDFLNQTITLTALVNRRGLQGCGCGSVDIIGCCGQ